MHKIYIFKKEDRNRERLIKINKNMKNKEVLANMVIIKRAMYQKKKISIVLSSLQFFEI
jgi:hypothetical protein